ncbi:hypothetical protein F2Q69_00054705 [Brassica cretica]|uniref:Uncharacterized protein n=1 Tax=Brassica cretica TaxID=69181 RepID=A0A8S9MUU9_BRACR|nr:hypothetical protein F2Q69_00054705 [Brassica cretica]
MQTQWIESRTLQLEEPKLHIQVELLELEKQRFRWESRRGLAREGIKNSRD